MDRENTPQKQRQKRSGNRRNSNGTHGTSSRSSMSSTAGAPRAFRGSQRPRSRTAAAPSAIMSKPPSMLLRPSAGPATGVLYEPDAPRRRPSDNYLQVNTRLSASSGRMASPSPSLRTGSPGRVLRPPTPSIQQTKIVPPSTCVKLITPHMQFSTDLAGKLGDSLELTNFTVVGVLGLEGVGKSTVLSLLTRGDKDVFSTRSLESVMMDQHETTGVDLAISMAGGPGHPTILLDSQPLLSSSMLADLLERNESQRFGALTPEQQVEAASYQIAVFLIAICHYVVIVHDGLAFQVSVRALLRKVQHKYAQCRLPSVSGNSQKHAAQLLYVANNLADSELLYRENELFSAHERALEAVWPHALIRVSYKVSSYSNPAGDDTNVFNMASFVLPHKQQQNVSRGSKVGTRSSSASPPSEIKKRKDQNKTKPLLTSNKYLTFDEAAGGFQRFVLSLPSSPSFTSQTVPMTPGSNAIPHVLSLREWLSNASRVFDAVRKASCFTAEYTSSRDHH